MLAVLRDRQQSLHFLATQHVREPARTTAARDAEPRGLTPEHAVVQEAERVDRNVDRAGRQMPFERHARDVPADLLIAEVGRRPVEVSGEPCHEPRVGLDGPRRQASSCHLIDHARAKRGHGDLLAHRAGNHALDARGRKSSCALAKNSRAPRSPHGRGSDPPRQRLSSTSIGQICRYWIRQQADQRGAARASRGLNLRRLTRQR